ncbi:hypothetical protein Droror1_Dr00002261, partial [Drosera rotundifolia]
DDEVEKEESAKLVDQEVVIDHGAVRSEQGLPARVSLSPHLEVEGAERGVSRGRGSLSETLRLLGENRDSFVEAGREEVTVEEEISKGGQLLEAGEKDGELNCVDKFSNEGRLAFVENHLDDAFDSVDKPLDGKRCSSGWFL